MSYDDSKTDEMLELERDVLTILWANPNISTFEEFRRLFIEHLKNECFFDEFRVELALRSLDRGDLEFPKGILFTPPAATPPPRR